MSKLLSMSIPNDFQSGSQSDSLKVTLKCLWLSKCEFLKVKLKKTLSDYECSKDAHHALELLGTWQPDLVALLQEHQKA